MASSRHMLAVLKKYKALEDCQYQVSQFAAFWAKNLYHAANFQDIRMAMRAPTGNYGTPSIKGY